MENIPLQQRAGKNPEPRAFSYPLVATARSRVFRAKDTEDNIVLSGSSKEQRAIPLGAEAVGLILNFTGGDIGYAAYFVDDQDNEYLLESGTIGDGSSDDIDFGEGFIGLLPGEKIILRITSGDPDAGDGCNVLAGHITVPEDIAVLRTDVPGTSLVDLCSPGAGELWQAVGPTGEAETLLMANGDTDDHTFNIYINEGGQDYLIRKAVLIRAGRVEDLNVLEESGGLSYGQTLKVKMLESRTVAGSRIMFVGTVVKVALSKDDTP
jgi:hypothetical protein